MTGSKSRLHESVASLVERFIAAQSPETLESLITGELVLGLAVPNPLMTQLKRLSVEDGERALAGKSVTELKRFLQGPTAVPQPHPLLVGRQSAEKLIDAILESGYGFIPTRNREDTKRGHVKRVKGVGTKPDRTGDGGKTVSPLDPDAVAEKILAGVTEEEARSLLQLGRYKDPYHAIANRIGYHFRNSDTVQILREQIIKHAVIGPRSHSMLERLGTR